MRRQIQDWSNDLRVEYGYEMNPALYPVTRIKRGLYSHGSCDADIHGLGKTAAIATPVNYTANWAHLMRYLS